VYEHREQFVLCVSERSLLPVVVAAKDARTLVPRFRNALAELLARLDVSPAAIERERAEMAEGRLGRTASRQVLGTMNDFLRMFSWRARPLVAGRVSPARRGALRPDRHEEPR
jgi:hypothetical protein